MKKIVTLSALSLGILFLAGCGQQPVSQTQPTTPAPVTQTPAQPVATQQPATQPANETADWKIYINSRVGYKFSYPSTNLTHALDETIKYPSAREGDSKNQDLVQFAVGNTSFGIRTYVGEGKSTIESWIQEPNAQRAYSDLSKYEKVAVGGQTAYRIIGSAFVYVLANGNVYEITAYQTNAPVKISSEPLFEKWVSTIEFTK